MKVSQFRNEIRASGILAHRYLALHLRKERIHLCPFRWINVIWHNLWSSFFSLILTRSVRPICWELWEEVESKGIMHTLSLLPVKYPVHLQIRLVLETGESAWLAAYIFRCFLHGGLICIACLQYTCMQYTENGSFRKLHLFCIIPQ